MTEQDLWCGKHRNLLRIRGAVFAPPRAVGGVLVATNNISLVPLRKAKQGTGMIIIAECASDTVAKCYPSWLARSDY